MMLTNVLSRGCMEGPQGVTRGVILRKSWILDSAGGVTRGVIRGVILRKTGEDKCVDKFC